MSFNIAPQEVGEVRRTSRSTRNDSVIGIQGDSSNARQEGFEPQWKPSVRLYLAFLTLSVITMMVALDGTSLSAALPVGILRIHVSIFFSDITPCSSYLTSSEEPPSKLSGPGPPFSYAQPSFSRASPASPTYSEEGR